MNLNGFLLNLTLLFIYLHFTSYIEWSWWKILSPMMLAAVSHSFFMIIDSFLRDVVATKKDRS